MISGREKNKLELFEPVSYKEKRHTQKVPQQTESK